MRKFHVQRFDHFPRFGTGQFTDEVTFSPTFQPCFFAIVSRFIRLLISGARSFAKVID